MFTKHLLLSSKRAVSSVVEHLVYTEFWVVFAVFALSLVINFGNRSTQGEITLSGH
jgi:hypothetical protein